MRNPLHDIPPTVRTFVIGLTVLYVAVASWALPHSRVLVVTGLAAIFVFTYLVEPIPNPSGGSIFPNNSVKIVAALLWPPQEVLIGIAIGSFLGLLVFRKYEWWRAMINGEGWGLSAWVATLATHFSMPSTTPTIAHLVLAAFVAVAANRVTNEGIFAIYKAQRFGHPFFATWLQNILDQWPSQVFAAPIGIVLATIAVRTGSTSWALTLTAVSAIALPIPRQELAYYHRAQQMLGEIVESMVRALEGTGPGAREHGDRVSTYAVQVGRRLGMSEQSIRTIRLASRLHDVGILAGPEGASPHEHHAAVGGRILGQFPDPMIAAIVRAHHERWDGNGLPDHKRGNAIPLGARILAAAEIYDSAREGLAPYDKPLSPQEAASHLISLAGTVLDPRIVMMLLRVVSEQQKDLGAVG